MPPTSQWNRSGYCVVEWLPQIVIFFTSVTGAPSFWAICVTARLWSRRVIAVKRPGSRSLALDWAMRALVFAGLPTTRILTSFLALRESASPCGLKIPPFADSRSARSMPCLARHRPDEQGDVGVTERGVGVVGADDLGEQREGAVVELHLHARSARRAPA